MTKRNEEYYSLKTRIDNWGVLLLFIYPLFGGMILIFGGASLGHRLMPHSGGMVGFLMGGLFTYLSMNYLLKKKLGFTFESNEKCQKCFIPIARRNGGWISLDYLCRKCGNNNSISIRPTKM